jgi:hypothetical protein
VEELPQIISEAVARALKLFPGDSDRAPARCDQDSVSLPISLEGRGRGMKGPAVELHHHALLAPHGVDLESHHLGVHLRLREAVLVDELQEQHLEVASDDLRSGVSRL